MMRAGARTLGVRRRPAEELLRQIIDDVCRHRERARDAAGAHAAAVNSVKN
jgi:hypothetical protein